MKLCHVVMDITIAFRNYNDITYIDQAPKCLCDLVRMPSSAISLHLLHSLDRLDLFVPRMQASMVQTRAFAIIDPALL